MTIEFMIGLLATALCPADEDDWREHWSQPPIREVLADAFGPLAPAFKVDGGGPHQPDADQDRTPGYRKRPRHRLTGAGPSEGGTPEGEPL
jgi:hypothetical protein